MRWKGVEKGIFVVFFVVFFAVFFFSFCVHEEEGKLVVKADGNVQARVDARDQCTYMCKGPLSSICLLLDAHSAAKPRICLGPTEHVHVLISIGRYGVQKIEVESLELVYNMVSSQSISCTRQIDVSRGSLSHLYSRNLLREAVFDATLRHYLRLKQQMKKHKSRLMGKQTAFIVALLTSPFLAYVVR